MPSSIYKEKPIDRNSSFKALGCAVQVCNEADKCFWIVPEYTKEHRHEMSIDHLEKIVKVCETFGVDVRKISFKKLKSLLPPVGTPAF